MPVVAAVPPVAHAAQAQQLRARRARGLCWRAGERVSQQTLVSMGKLTEALEQVLQVLIRYKSWGVKQGLQSLPS